MDSLDRAILIALSDAPNGLTVNQLLDVSGTSRATLYRKINKLAVSYPITSRLDGKQAVYSFIATERIKQVKKEIIDSMLIQRSDFEFTVKEKLLIEMMFDNYSRIPAVSSDVEELKKKMDVLFSLAGYVSPEEKTQAGFLKDLKRHVRRIDSFQTIPKASENSRMEMIFQLADASLKHKVCQISYCSPEKGIHDCEIRPLCVFIYLGGFYVIAETEKYDYSSKWSIERIISLKETETVFVPKSPVPTEHILSEPFGLPQEDQFEARIQIRKKQVPYILSYAWPSSRVSFSESDTEGDVIMNVVTSGAYELIKWCRYQGSEVKLLSPDFLVERLKASCQELNDTYGGSKNGRVSKNK